MGGDVVSIFAMSEWPVGDDGAMCVLTKSFLWDSTKESFCRFFWAKRKQPIVLYCIGSKRDGEIGWILTWKKSTD